MTKHEQQAILLLASILLGIYLFLSYSKTTPATSGTKAFPTSGLRYVQIAGQVATPGLYTFYGEPSVQKIIARAGSLKAGPLPSPEILSQKVPSASRVVIIPGSEGLTGVEILPLSNATRFLLDIPMPLNTATKEDLQIIPGIGPTLAHSIITFRNQNGPFRDMARLKAVKGIGEKKLSRIVHYVTLDNQALRSVQDGNHRP